VSQVKVAESVIICERRPATSVFPLCGAIMVAVRSNTATMASCGL